MIKLLPIRFLFLLLCLIPMGLSANATPGEDAFDGGVIFLMNGATETTICVGDGIPDPLMVMLMDSEGPYDTWVVTDTDGRILAIQESNTFDFEGAGAGTCVIWHMSYKDIVGPFEVGMLKDNVGGWLDYSNPVTVTREPIAASSISVDGATEISICIDGTPDPLQVDVTGGVGQYSTYLVTDEALNILAVSNNNNFDFESAGEGVCLIWRLNFNNVFGNVVGLNAANLGGCFQLSNPITVTRQLAEGATIALEDGSTEISICAGDGVEDPFTPTVEGGVGESNAWVITDEDLNILALPEGPTFDLEGAGNGTCLVWYLSFNGELTGAMVGGNAANLGGCFALSNPITVNRDGVSGGDIELEGGGDMLEICAGDGISDEFGVVITGATGATQVWVITDEDLNILAIPSGPTFDLEGAGEGTCLLWNLSYSGNITGAEVGLNAGDLTGCFDLSNPITVVRNEVAGASITTGGATELAICAGDGVADPFEVEVEGGTGSSSAWIITDEDLNILGLPTGPTFDLDGAGAGVCLLWYATFNGELSGVAVGENAGDIEGCYALSNPITVTRTGVEGGSLTFEDGGDAITICAGDGVADEFAVSLTGNSGESSAWVITDEDLNILALPMGPTFDLEGAGAGVCLLWNLSFTGEITGAEVGANAANLTGCFSLSNSISITRNGVAAAAIALEDGSTELSICAGDGVSDAFTPTIEGGEGTNSAWVITDDSLNIIGLPDGPTFDLDGAGEGVCLLWYVTYNDTISGVMMGENAADLSGCFALSNAITITRTAVEGASISFGEGLTELTICAGDGQSDAFEVQVEGGSGANSAWVITDTDLNILGLPDGPTFDLEGAGSGVCQVWYLTYNGELTGVEVGANVADVTGCLALSNPINVTRNGVAAAAISIEGGGDEISICAGDGISDAFTAIVEGGEGESSAWVITDEDLNILGLPEGPTFDLDEAGAGTCLVWNLNFNGEISGAEVGANAADLEGCYALSNPITVIRSGVMGASLSLEGGATEISICAGDGNSDALALVVEDASGMNNAWVITDADLNILGLPDGPTIDLEGAGEGVCLIWYLSFNGEITGAEVGANAANLQGCFALSNSVTVTRTGVASATIDSDMGTDISICAGDGVADPFTVSVEGGEGEVNGFIITDTAGVILGLPEGPTFDLEEAGSGVCLVWYYNANESLGDIAVGDTVANIETCFALSNPITVTRTGASGATLSLEGGIDSTSICVGDGMPDLIIPMAEGGEGENEAWVITDENGMIVGLPAMPPFNLEAAGAGVCLIWKLSFNGEITGAEVGANAADLSGCFALSNPIRVERNAVAGGEIAFDDDDDAEITICVGDSNIDSIRVNLEGNVGENGAWVITDADLNILGLPAAPPFTFEEAGDGNCLIWFLSFNGEITGAEVGANAADLAGCFQLSNSLSVVRVSEGDDCNDGQIRPDDVDIFPNPTNGSISLKMKYNLDEVISVRVFDSYGQLVMFKNDLAKEGMKLSTEDLQSGVYYINVIQGTNNMVKEFVKL